MDNQVNPLKWHATITNSTIALMTAIPYGTFQSLIMLLKIPSKRKITSSRSTMF